MKIKVGVAEGDDQIYLRGLLEALGEDPSFQVTLVSARGGTTEGDFDVIVASEGALRQLDPSSPVIVLSNGDATRMPPEAKVVGVLPRAGLTEDRLRLAVRATAVGLRVEAETEQEEPAPLDARRIAILRELADGADTKTIADRLKYSERTIKTLIHDIQQRLGSQTRAQAVAEAIRHGLI